MAKPRMSGIPTPGRSTSGIPTPGRSRSSSAAGHYLPTSQSKHEVDEMSRAFADAIKANDPSKHRNSQASDVSGSPTSMSSRPSSVASVRPKTPSYARPLSRQSQAERSSSRAGTRSFEVGDSVRIESLGFEGALRFIGEIEGKGGLWAGVELSGGFAGRGKNDGSVGGKQYFTCPPKCGVFIATTKLSAPAQRPASVIGGRVTPSFTNGRVTPSAGFRSTSSRPSLSNGRITPSGRTTPASSSGRITPGSSTSETPGARSARLRTPGKRVAVPVSSAVKTPTPGTRASKYAGMTAQQLSTIHSTPDSKLASPGSISRGIPSPSRSPFSTPKPRGPLSAGPGTPRARIPSAIAMPPPPVPMSPSRSVSAGLSINDLDQRGKDLQAKIAALTNTKRDEPNDVVDLTPPATSIPPSPRRTGTGSVPSSPRRPDTALSSPRMVPGSPSRRPRSSVGVPTHRATSSLSSINNERVDGLLDENERLRTDLDNMKNEMEKMKDQREEDMQAALAEAQAAKDELDIVRSELQSAADENKDKADVAEAKISDLENSLKAADDAKEAQGKDIADLKEAMEKQEEAVKAAETARAGLEIDVGKLKKTIVDLEDERHDLMSMVDELRQAGQETIALYEEKLRACDVKRYELEDRIADLEARMRDAPGGAPEPSAPVAITGTEIDNETLRDQVVHLQKKIATLEDMIEDSRAAAEKEEAALRDKMRRVKEKEDAMRKEILDARKEIEIGVGREELAKRRTEEVEEALRESSVALANAQAEVETIRNEMDQLNGLVESQSSSHTKFQEVAERASVDKEQFQAEISRLQGALDEAQHTSADHDLIRKTEELERMAEEQILKIGDLTEQIEAQASELETLRKKSHREAGVSPATPDKREMSAAREEIKGLKHIVRTLQEEAVGAAQRHKTLESENQLLISEMEQLREEVKILEENIDQSILREEAAVNGTAAPEDADVKSMKRKFEAETEQLRKRMNEAEKKTARIQHDLNKEISELESLVESKIYREDELEQEIERLKEKVARQKKSSSSSGTYHHGGSTASLSSLSSAGSIQSSGTNTIVPTPTGEPVCEICERPGHDIFNCNLLEPEKDSTIVGGAGSLFKANGAPVADQAAEDVDEKQFCEDCETWGHLAADCPHSMDVF